MRCIFMGRYDQVHVPEKRLHCDEEKLVCEGVTLAFLLLWGDVFKPRNTTSDPADHEFGNFRTKIWEFTTLEFSHLKKTTERRSRMMFASGFDLSRDPKKVDQAKHANWVNYNRTDSLLHDGPVGVYDKYGTV